MPKKDMKMDKKDCTDRSDAKPKASNANRKRIRITCITEKEMSSRGGDLYWRRIGASIANGNTEAVMHLPTRAVNGLVDCPLHSFLGIETKCKVFLYCNTCYVHLCVTCYKPFHEIENHEKLKKEIEKLDRLDNNVKNGNIPTADQSESRNSNSAFEVLSASINQKLDLLDKFSDDVSEDTPKESTKERIFRI